MTLTKQLSLFTVLLLLSSFAFTSCDDIFGSKDDDITDNIFVEGRQDPNNVDEVVGFSSLLPFWDGFTNPKDIFVGYDELVYVVDDIGLHVLDLAGRRFRTLELRDASDVTMDRNLNIFVSARDSIPVPKNVNGQEVLVNFDLPVIYKLRNLNTSDEVNFIDTLTFPFDDGTRNTFSSQSIRLNRDRDDNYEKVQITGLATRADNALYVTRTGPGNGDTRGFAPDNTVMIFTREFVDGEQTEKMRFSQYLATIDPVTPSLKSGIGLTSIETFVGPPQREQMSSDQSFLITQTQQQGITETPPYKALWISAVQTVDGLEYQANSSLLEQDTTEANRFLYETNRFEHPTDITYSTDGRGFIFVTDSGTDSVYMFQSNGFEGINPPVGSEEDKAIIISFGGEGNGPKQFIDPQGVVYFDQILYVADSGNGRIARYKLSTDFE